VKILTITIEVPDNVDLNEVGSAIVSGIASELVDLDKAAITAIGTGVSIEPYKWDNAVDWLTAPNPYFLAAVAA
jgi:hypothetical protein